MLLMCHRRPSPRLGTRLTRPLTSTNVPAPRRPAASWLAAALLTGWCGCYRAPDLPTTPYEAPVLSSSEGGPFTACAPRRDVVVACTVDGDTLDVGQCGESAGGERVRLLGIDAPETEKPGQEVECFADRAASELQRIAAGRYLTLTFDAECTDTFGRTLAYVWMDLRDAEIVLDGPQLDELVESSTFDEDDASPQVLLNEYLLLGGFVQRFSEEWVEDLRWEQDLIAAERLAYARQQGLWSSCEVSAPAAP
jgi:endonuclease YncB( thermonuclease family)